jgi:uncharacterized protein (TIGR02147 family)
MNAFTKVTDKIPNIYQYSDYRAFLRGYFSQKKAASKAFSHQNFARKAQIKSSGFMLHVMKNERNLTKPVLLKVARAIGLNPAETEYFEYLVSFDQAKTQADKVTHITASKINPANLALATTQSPRILF